MKRAAKRRTKDQRRAASDAEHRLSALAGLVEGLASAIGPHCEVVLHDFRSPTRSIVAIGGRLTNRSVGGSMSEIGLSLLARGNDAQDQSTYMTRLPSGRQVKSTTLVLRDNRNKVFGALCLNFDVTGVTEVAELLAAIAGREAEGRVPATFTNDIKDVINVVLAQQLPNEKFLDLSPKQRVALFAVLDEKGVFGIRKGIMQVADRFGISRATAYSYLVRARKSKT